ncbi:hypothetical protein ES703_115052 [subsurface metagenome]
MNEPQSIELSGEELDALLERVKAKLPEGDYKIIKAMADMIKFLSFAVNEKDISIKRLLRMMFGAAT